MKNISLLLIITYLLITKVQSCFSPLPWTKSNSLDYELESLTNSYGDAKANRFCSYFCRNNFTVEIRVYISGEFAKFSNYKEPVLCQNLMVFGIDGPSAENDESNMLAFRLIDAACNNRHVLTSGSGGVFSRGYSVGFLQTKSNTLLTVSKDYKPKQSQYYVDSLLQGIDPYIQSKVKSEGCVENCDSLVFNSLERLTKKLNEVESILGVTATPSPTPTTTSLPSSTYPPTTQPTTTSLPSSTYPPTTEPTTSTYPSSTYPPTTEPTTTSLPSSTYPPTTEPTTSTYPSSTYPPTTEPSTSYPSSTYPPTTQPTLGQPSTSYPTGSPPSPKPLYFFPSEETD